MIDCPLPDPSDPLRPCRRRGIKTRSGFITHLKGTKPYGGHELAASARLELADKMFPDAAAPDQEIPAEAHRSSAGEKKSGDEPEIGPQVPGETGFKARMRLHQSWYRAHILRLCHGTGPTATDVNPSGSMLKSDDGNKGMNFVGADIFKVARERMAAGSGVEPFRNKCNMLSSQPMCFNLFGKLRAMLVLDKEPVLVRRLLEALLGIEVSEVSRVEIEWAPEPKAEYLGDSTSFDVAVDFKDSQGHLCLFGVETKLTEPFSRECYDGKKYRKWVEEYPDSPWRRDSWSRLADSAHNQIWRGHALAFALGRHKDSKYSKTIFGVVRHPEDGACDTAVQGYVLLLKPGCQSFLDITLDAIVRKWTPLVKGTKHAAWLKQFVIRYVELRQSGASAHSKT